MLRNKLKIIEDLIARKKVNAITIVPNDANVLEPVFKKARDAGIVVLTNESPVSSAAGILKSLITKNLPLNMLSMAKRMGARAAM